MKKSISIWSFHGQWSLAEKMQLAKKAGFEGIELDLSEEGDLHLGSTEQEIRYIAELAADTGLTLSGFATGLYWGCNPASDSQDVREKAQTILTKQLHTAALLNIDAILVVPGAVGADFIPGCEEIPYDKAWQRASDFIAEALPLATSLGVTICIENVWNKFLLSPLEMKQFIEQFNSPFVGCYFDIANVLATGYPEHWPQILGDKIKRVHVKDYRRAIGTVDGFVDLLSGDVNWPAVMQALKNSGYDHWLTAEMIPPVPFYKHGPEVLIDTTSKAMDFIIGLHE